MKKALLTLWQLAASSKDYNADGAPYQTEAEANAAREDMARERLEGRFADAEELREALDNAGVDLGDKEIESINGLDDLSGDECFALAADLIDFSADVYQVHVEIDVYALSQAIRDAGAAPTVFTVEDVIDRFDGTPEEAADWLVSNRRHLDDALSTRGNEWIEDMLATDGKLADEDDGEPDPDAIKIFVFSGGVALGGPGQGFFYAPVDVDDGPRLSGDTTDLPIFGPFPSIQAAEQGARDKEGAERIYFVELDDMPDWMPPGY